MAAGQGGRARNPPKRRRPTRRNTDLDLLRVLVRLLLLFVIAIVIAIVTSLFFVTKFALGL